MFVCFDNFFYGQKKIPQEGHSIDDSRTTFGSILACLVTEIFHECCPFRNTPLPLGLCCQHFRGWQALHLSGMKNANNIWSWLHHHIKPNQHTTLRTSKPPPYHIVWHYCSEVSHRLFLSTLDVILGIWLHCYIANNKTHLNITLYEVPFHKCRAVYSNCIVVYGAMWFHNTDGIEKVHSTAWYELHSTALHCTTPYELHSTAVWTAQHFYVEV